MEPMNSKTVSTKYGNKKISVYSCNILDFPEQIDILTTSAYRRSYVPVPGSMFRALHTRGIRVDLLAEEPEIDLRTLSDVWLSKQIPAASQPIRRIGCIELRAPTDYDTDPLEVEARMLNSIKSYFLMLDLAAVYNIPMETVVLPLLGAGNQQISHAMLTIPIINECVAFLKRNSAVKNIYFVDYNQKNAFTLAMAIENSYLLRGEAMSIQKTAPVHMDAVCENPDQMTFISYSSYDRNIADNLCAKLEQRGMRVWYAPRNVGNSDYATAIVEAIRSCTHFVVISSVNSMQSQHVLNEIDQAFQELGRGIRFLPLRMDSEDMTPAFSYYLSRQHWMDAHIPPIEKRLEEFADRILNTHS